MEIDQEGIRRKRQGETEIRPGTIPDEGKQELRPPDQTPAKKLDLERGVLRPEQLSSQEHVDRLAGVTDDRGETGGAHGAGRQQESDGAVAVDDLDERP